MSAGSTLVTSKQSVTLPFFPVKLKTAQKQKVYSAHFIMDGMRLFVFFAAYIRINVKERKDENENKKKNTGIAAFAGYVGNSASRRCIGGGNGNTLSCL